MKRCRWCQKPIDDDAATVCPHAGCRRALDPADAMRAAIPSPPPPLPPPPPPKMAGVPRSEIPDPSTPPELSPLVKTLQEQVPRPPAQLVARLERCGSPAGSGWRPWGRIMWRRYSRTPKSIPTSPSAATRWTPSVCSWSIAPPPSGPSLPGQRGPRHGTADFRPACG